jgi:hypothetical protein
MTVSEMWFELGTSRLRRRIVFIQLNAKLNHPSECSRERLQVRHYIIYVLKAYLANVYCIIYFYDVNTTVLLLNAPAIST